MKKFLSIPLACFAIAVLALSQSACLMAGELHLKVVDINGTDQLVSVSDGLEVSFSDNSLTITDDTHSLSYALTDVSKLTYVYAESPVVSIDRVEETPLLKLTPEGIEITLSGEHRLDAVTISGNQVLTEVFTDAIHIDRDRLPAGVIILSVDNSFSLKISAR